MVVNGFDDDQTRSFINLAAGTKVSHYKIISKIGAGGMGEVYLAEDSQLDRKVALKFLPPHLSQDEASRARFTREAKAAAKLDHPNIVPVYEVGECNGQPFFAMAHIEGKSLREVIKEGKLSISKTIELTMQICEGLNEAHNADVIHRDIKPGNIIIDSKGKPRILDFGLATVAGEEKLTKTGSTLGTISYMSPEQIEGKQVDHRSDLFSVGVILYEMLTGRRPFKGENDAAIIKAIIDDTPEPISRYKSGVSGELQQVVNKVLTRDPRLRYQHSDDLLADLRRERELLSDPSYIPGIVHIVKAGQNQWAYIIATLVVIVCAVIIYMTFFTDKTKPLVVASQHQVTFYGDVDLLDISLDGSYFIYTRQFDTNQILYIQDFSGGEAIKLLTWDFFSILRLSPDGTEIAVSGFPDYFGSNQGTYILPRLGGSTRKVHSGMCAELRIDWSPISPHLAIQESCTKSYKDSIVIINVESGEVDHIPINIPFKWAWSLCWINSGEGFLFAPESASEISLWTIDFEGGSPAKIMDGKVRNLRRSSRSDRFYCLYDGDLLKLPFDVSSRTIRGDSVTLLADQQMVRFSVSADDQKLLYNKQSVSSNLWLVTLNDRTDSVQFTTLQLTEGTGVNRCPSFSPDGKHIAYIDKDGQVLVIPASGGKARRITHSGNRHFSPKWSPDGRQLATSSTFDNKKFIVSIIDAKGGQPKRFEEAVTETEGKTSWILGHGIVFHQPGYADFLILNPETGDITPVLDADTLGWVFSPSPSPRGDQLAIFWNRPDYGLWIVSLTDSLQTLVLSEFSCYPLNWSEGEDSIYFASPSVSSVRMGFKYICRVEIQSGGIDTILTLPFEDVWHVSMSPDRRQLVCEVKNVQNDLWLVENFDPEVK